MDVKNERIAKGPELRRLYVMTNGDRAWLAELKHALKSAAEGQWDEIVTSRDLSLSREQKYVAQALDMYIGQRAQSFIGNGVSFFLPLILPHAYS